MAQSPAPAPDPLFQDPQHLTRGLAGQGYRCPREAAVTLYLAARLDRPVLVEGPAGVGKTELARATARAGGRELIRLQCYEGLDESRALYEWEYGKQLLYTQLLKDRIGETLAGATTLTEAMRRLQAEESGFFSPAFLAPRPLLRAILADHPTVLLIDEVDRADPEFEAFLLEVLSDFQVSVPELGTLTARHRPLALLTSNATRPLSDALRRRCLYLHLDYPDPEREREIVRARLPNLDDQLADQVVRFVQRARRLNLRKPPSVGETLDWGAALLLLNARSIDRDVLRDSLGALVKDPEDVDTLLREAGRPS